jgi:tellurite resistance protein
MTPKLRQIAEHWVRIGLAVANAEGGLDVRELGVVRAAALRHSRLEPAVVDGMIQGPRYDEAAFDASLRELRQLSDDVEAALEELAFVYDVAAADGVLDAAELRLLEKAAAAFVGEARVAAVLQWLKLRHAEREAFHRCLPVDASDLVTPAERVPRRRCDVCDAALGVDGAPVLSYARGPTAYGYFCKASCRETALARFGLAEDLWHQPRVCRCDRCLERLGAPSSQTAGG